MEEMDIEEFPLLNPDESDEQSEEFLSSNVPGAITQSKQMSTEVQAQ